MRKIGLAVLVLAVAAFALNTPARAQDTIKIGWAISKTGPFAAGAAVTGFQNV